LVDVVNGVRTQRLMASLSWEIKCRELPMSLLKLKENMSRSYISSTR